MNLRKIDEKNYEEIARIKIVMSVLRIQKHKAKSIMVGKYGL